MSNLLTMLPPRAVTADPNATALSDAPERQQALDITRSFIVEAPAGSGKTGLLIQRFLKLLASDTVTDPAQLLAITFTRKATAELHERSLDQLLAAHHATPPANAFDRQTRPFAQAVLDRDHARSPEQAWRLLDQPHRLNIRTIDSLAMNIAAGLPILSGSSGSRTPTPDAAPLYAEAARRTVLQLGGRDTRLTQALEIILLHRDGNLAACERLIAGMLASRDQWGELIPLAAPYLEEDPLDEAYLDTIVLPKFERVLDLAICRGLTRLNQILPPPILESLCALAAEMAHAEGYKGAISPIAICRDRNQPPREKAEDLDHWRAIVHLLVKPSKPRDWRKSFNVNHVGFQVLKHHQADLKAIIESLAGQPGPSIFDELCRIDALPPTTYPGDQWRVTKALFHVLSRALAELQLVFSTHSACDFSELSLLARATLRTGSALDDLRASANMDLQHLLVDEMQDTSSSQYELLQLLTQRWDGHSQTVFLVGDPKQSIYLFRQARVERFVHTMHTGRLSPAPDSLTLTALHLTANFRSQASLVQAFNADFAQIFPRTPDPLQPELVPYRPVTAVRPASPRAGILWHTAVLPYSGVADECASMRRTQRRIDAAQIAAVIRTWTDARRITHPEPATIAILVRNRIHLAEVVPALKRAAIPYRAVEIEPLAERQEILDLIALTRALLHPADRTAWLALLRAPWCGLTLADLHLLAGQDDPAFAEHTILSLIRDRGDLLSEDGIARIAPLWTVLTAALEERGRTPLAPWVHRTWRALGAHLFADEESLLSAERFFALLDELEESTGVISLPRLTQRLARLYATPSVHPGAVDLVTIHGAKGLEWDLVLVPALERIGLNNYGRLLDWLETDAGPDSPSDDMAHGIVAPIRAKGGPAARLNDWMRSIETTREAAERKRLFYVACTRAREELHLFATLEQSKGELKPRSGSLLAAAWPAAEPHFATLQPSNLIPLPASRPTTLPGLAIAAAAAPATRTIQRYPIPRLPLVQRAEGKVIEDVHRAEGKEIVGASSSPPPTFTRPEGSFAARAFGNALHTFLELLATSLSQEPAPKPASEPDTKSGAPCQSAASPRIDLGLLHSQAAALLIELPTWPPRITAVLRATGLPAPEIQRFTTTILRALSATLTDPTGQWLLAPHPQAASESAIVSWQQTGSRTGLRIDRTFLAGPEPLAPGDTHLWIIDYKTATHGPAGLDAYLTQQQDLYRPQLETYARELASPGQPVRLALFYPLLSKLIWWKHEPHSA